MDHVEWSKHRGLVYLGAFWGIFSPRNHITALLSSNLVIPAHSRCLPFRKSSRKFERRQQLTSLPLTTTMVNPKISKNSIKTPTLPPGLQDSSQHVGESPNSLNLLSRTSSRAGKQVHSRGRPQTRHIARRFSRSVSASSASRNPSPEALSSSSSGESEEESVGSDPKTSTAPRVTTGKLSFKKLPSLKLPAAFPALIPEGKVSTMSWDDQVAAEKGRDLVSGPETAPQAI